MQKFGASLFLDFSTKECVIRVFTEGILDKPADLGSNNWKEHVKAFDEALGF